MGEQETIRPSTGPIHLSPMGGAEPPMDGPDSAPDSPWRDERRLQKLFAWGRLSVSELATEFGYSEQTIENWLARTDISRPWEHESTLRFLREDRELSQREIARRLGCTHQQEKMSTYEIADEYDCARSTVHDWLARHDIETRDVGGQPGELHHRRQGGRDPYYGDNWHEMRRAALERDGYTRQNCGKTQREHEQEHSLGLDVHHVEPLAEFEIPEEANELNNLITLRRSCHNKIEQRGDDE